MFNMAKVFHWEKIAINFMAKSDYTFYVDLPKLRLGPYIAKLVIGR